MKIIVPDEVLKIAYAAWWENIRDSHMASSAMRAALIAALESWPGKMKHERLDVRDNGEGYYIAEEGIILPFPSNAP